MGSSLIQSCPGIGIEDLCQPVTAVPSILDKLKNPIPASKEIDDRPCCPTPECGVPGGLMTPLPYQPCQVLPWGQPSPATVGAARPLDTTALAGKTQAQHSAIVLAHGDKY